MSLIPVEGGENRPSDSVLHHESRLILGKRQLFEAAKLEPAVLSFSNSSFERKHYNLLGSEFLNNDLAR